MSAFERIAAGLNDAIAYAEGRAEPADYGVHEAVGLDVEAIRKRTGLSQESFAARYGFPVGRLRRWESRRSAPDATSRLLLTIIDKEPEAVERARQAG